LERLSRADRDNFGGSGTAALDRRCRQHDESADRKRAWERRKEAFGEVLPRKGIAERV
jgi:hypothetical protein